MSGRLFLLRDARPARLRSGPGLRHIWASASQASLPLIPLRLNLAADIANGGRSELASQNTVLGRIHKLEKDMAGMKATPTTGLPQPRSLIDKCLNSSDLYTKRMMGFGAGMALLGIGAGLSKVLYDYDVNRQNEMKNYIRDVFGNFESKMDQRFDSLESKMDQSMERMESRMDQSMERMESRMDQCMERIGSRLDSMESKMDQKMDEVISILKAKKGWW
ncbi:hypothetical protein HOY82DRAFT_640535 [Tuber indicum]|nr:hypothetical protein HOY82DRAFT_640535 [Tuber indicum]